MLFAIQRLHHLFYVVLVLLLAFPKIGNAQYCLYCSRPQYLEVPTSAETFRTGLQFQYIYRSHRSDGQSVDRDEKVADTVANLYGLVALDPQVDVEINLPVISRAYTRSLADEKISTRDTAIGDASVLGVFHILPASKTEPIRLSVRGGLKLPTGSSDDLKDENDPRVTAGGSLVRGRDLAAGSGSIDFPLGARLSYQDGSIASFLDASYILKLEGDENYQYGNDLGLSAGFGFLALERSKAKLNLGVISRFNNRGKDRMEGETLANSGSSILSLGPVAQVSIKDRFDCQVEVGLPVARDASGSQLLPDYLVQVQATARY